MHMRHKERREKETAEERERRLAADCLRHKQRLEKEIVNERVSRLSKTRTMGSDLYDIYLSGDLIYLMEDWETKCAAYYCIDTFLSDILFIRQVLREQMLSDKSEPTVCAAS